MIKKGQTKQIWTKEQNLSIIKRYCEEHVCAGTFDKEHNADKGNLEMAP